MSNYKSKHTGKQIDDAIDALSTIRPSFVRQEIGSSGKCTLELGKTYYIKNSNASPGSWDISISCLIYTIAGEIEDKIAYLTLPEYDKYADGITIKLLGVDIEKGPPAGTEHDYTYQVCINYDIGHSNSMVRKYEYIASGEADNDYNIEEILKYEFSVRRATDVLIYNDQSTTIYAEPGNNCYIRYSAYADGTDFTEEWSEGQTYMGQATAPEAPEDKSEYKWSKFIDDSVNEALDHILEIQQSLIGYDVKVRNCTYTAASSEAGCYVSKTKPIHSKDVDVYLPGMDIHEGSGYVNETLSGVRKLYVWTDNPEYYPTAYKSVNGGDFEFINYYEYATSWDKACVIEVDNHNGIAEYAFIVTR